MAFRQSKPDRALCHDQLQALQAMVKAWGVAAFLAGMFWILAKTDDVKNINAQPTRLVPFILNPIQRHLLTQLETNNLLLKARQMGGTTFFLLVRGLLNVITNEGTNALLVSQSSEFAEMHFLMAVRAYRYFGMNDPRQSENEINVSMHQNLLHTKYTNRRELYFDQLESRLAVASAEVTEAGQGLTLHHIIGSEYSRWPKRPAETLANIRGALAPGGTLDIECTANGAAGSFFEKYQLSMLNRAASDAKAHFYPWWNTPEYRLDLNEKQMDELEKDLSEDERKLIAQMHTELTEVSWVEAQPNRIFV
jgi:hypothetical protein